MSDDKVILERDHGVRTVNGTEVRISELVWRSGGSSWQVHRVWDDVDLTEAESFDSEPTDDDIAALLCPHENQVITDRSQFRCADCGEELGR